jgi:hypothetical protein
MKANVSWIPYGPCEKYLDRHQHELGDAGDICCTIVLRVVQTQSEKDAP